MYKRIRIVDQLKPNDVVIRLQNTQDSQCTTATQLREIITTQQKLIDDLKEDNVLPLVAKCVEFFGSEVIVRKLKAQFPDDDIIRDFRGWSDCVAYAYQNGDGKKLQKHIRKTMIKHPNIKPYTWQTLRFLYQKRNKLLHGKITKNDIELLNDSVRYFQKYKNKYTRNNVNAIRKLHAALKNLPNDSFAQPQEYDLANLLL